jgi:hypothetical protein
VRLETALLDAALLETAPRGRYVEARTASVFAGACHFGGEATTAGREALLAWHFEGGEHAGVALAGVDAALVVAGDANLAEPGAARRSVLYVSERATAAQREAVRALLAGAFAAQLGELVATLSVPLDVAFDAETYRVASPGHFVLRGALLPDRACCRMPFQVWYTPFAPVASAVVGANSEFRCTDARLDRTWSRPDENASFAGSFRYTPRTAAQP